MVQQVVGLGNGICLAIAMLVTAPAVFSQVSALTHIVGQVTYLDSLPASRAIISVREKDSMRVLAFGIANKAGEYSMDVSIIEGRKYTVIGTASNFSSEELLISLPSGNARLINADLILKPHTKELQNVTVRSQLRLLRTGDTIEFKAAAYRNLETRKLADILRQMDGFTVSPAGHLMFQGKQVSALLIEGEDLVGSGYEVLTKNFPAKIIDKVQVVENYQSNRLLRGIEASDRVAVNLTMNAVSKGKVAGDLTLGGGTNRRWLLDASGVLLKGTVKTVVLADGNNTSQDPLGNLSGHLGSELTVGMPRQDVGAFLEASIIAPPFELPSYTSEQRSRGAAVALSTKLKDLKFRTLSGLKELELHRSGLAFGAFTLPDGGSWELSTSGRSTLRREVLFTRMEMERDTGGRSNQRLTVEMQLLRPVTEFHEKTMGSVSDARFELASARERTIDLNFENTWIRIPSGVWMFRVKGSIISRERSFQLQTNRLSSYFGLQPTAAIYYQEMIQLASNVRLQMHRSSRRGLYQSRYGINLGLGMNQMEDSILNGPTMPLTVLKRGDASASSVGADVFYTGSVPVNRAAEFAFSMLGRMQQINLKTQRKANPGYAVSLSINWKLTRQARLSITALSKLELPSVSEFYGGPLLTGGVMIVEGLQKIANRYANAANVQFLDANLLKARSILLAASWQHTRNDNSPFEVVSPEYIQLRYVPGATTGMLLLNGSSERYLKLLKAKVGLQLNSMSVTRKYLLNLQPTASLYRSCGIELKYLTRFNRLNLDLRARQDFFHSRLEQPDRPSVHSAFNQVSFFPGLRYARKDAFSVVSEMGFRRMGQKGWFTSFDLSSYFRAGKRLTASIKGHNLAGRKSIASKYITAFSESATYFQVVPRYVILKVSCDF